MIHVEHLAGFGAALKELRWAARMKQVEVCRATGMTAPQVSRYENAHEMPTVESLVKYLSAVGADFCDLQRVLEGGAAPAEPARPAPAAEAPPVDPAVARRVSLEQVREDGRRRLEANGGLQQVMAGLMSLNLEGMERLEQRLERQMRSIQEQIEELKAAAGQ